MVTKIRSLGLYGVKGYEVTAECDLSGGLPCFNVVGLPDAAVKESRERVRAAIKNSGFAFPVSRITVNLAPADRKKAGTVYDLPIFGGNTGGRRADFSEKLGECRLFRGAVPVGKCQACGRNAAHGAGRPAGGG